MCLGLRNPWVADVVDCQGLTRLVLWAGLSMLTVALGPMCRVGGHQGEPVPDQLSLSLKRTPLNGLFGLPLVVIQAEYDIKSCILAVPLHSSAGSPLQEKTGSCEDW